MSLATEYTDMRGNRFPKGEPGGVYLGSIQPGRVFYDHNGKRHKVVAQSNGSTSVIRDGRTRLVKDRAFTPKETITLARGSVVYLRPGGAPK